MTGTAQSVKYHVSDFLQDRHPYNYEQSYTAQKSRDQGKVFNGLLPVGLDKLLESIQDDQVEPLQKAVALKHLVAHSAAAEKKIELLRKGIVPMIVDMMLASPVPQVEQLATQLIRSLCILPQGIHCVVAEGGLHALAKTITARHNATDREAARCNAASALQLMAASWAGRAWILGLDCPQDMQLLGYDVPETSPEQRETLAQAVCDVLVNVLENDTKIPQIVNYALSALSQLTIEKEGLQKCLIAGALRATSQVLENYAKEDVWVYSNNLCDTEIALYGATAVWHMALDEVGKRELTELPLARQIGRIIAFVLPVKDKLLGLKAALAGATCAIMMYTPVKKDAVVEVAQLGGEPATLLDLIVQLVRQSTETYEPMYQAQKHGMPNPNPSIKLENVAAIVKNGVQAVRLIVEYPAAREQLKVALPLPKEYNLRRQLFYNTAFQHEFEVHAV